MSGSLEKLWRELAQQKLDLVGIQEVSWEQVGTELQEYYTRFSGRCLQYCHEFCHLVSKFYVRVP
jgi:glycogen synthase